MYSARRVLHRLLLLPLVSSTTAGLVVGSPFRQGYAARSPASLLRLGRLQGGSSHSRSMSATTSADAPAYEALLTELDAVRQLARVSSVLEYDKMVLMPAGAAAERGKQSAALAAVIHEKQTAARLGELLAAARAELDEDAVAAAIDDDAATLRRRNLELAAKEYAKNTCIPTELAARKAKLSAESYAAWAQARAADDFGQFGDVLGRCIDTAIELAQCRQAADPTTAGTAPPSVYATMLDEFETGMDPARIDDIFGTVKAALVPLIERVLGPSATPPGTDPLRGGVPLEAQQQLCRRLVEAIGYDTARGRIDVSVHPFTSSMNPHDVRITSRFRDDDWHQGLAATLHEGGHAIYEQNLPTEPAAPLNEALSMGLHESQSLFWERHVGLSRPFWDFAAPLVNDAFGRDHAAADYYAAVNAAAKSFIRVEADELTYPLHVILRYGIERDFVEGRLAAADIPARWNRDFRDCFGLEVPSDAQGCLQDIHWSMMAYGYFPTYLLGAVAAAQLEHYCRRDIPDFDAKLTAGEFGPIRAWLTDKVHRHGKRYRSIDEHLEAELGERLNPAYFIQYLTDKYTEIYKC